MKQRAVLLLMSLFLLASISPLQAEASADKCVFVFYDEGTPGPWAKFGEVYSIQLRNVLGHFPEFRQIVVPVEYYQSGMIENCQASIYLGSHYGDHVPQSFYDDVARTENNVLWMGYSVWRFGYETLADTFGVEYLGLTKVDEEQRDKNGDVSFYRYFHYKGETWRKSLSYENKEEKTKPLGAFEMTELNVFDGTEVMSWAEHSATGERLPYITRKNNFFYVADVPFSYIHEADRYFIFCDILFDLLEAEPKHKQNPGFVRIEDVHPLISTKTLKTIEDTFAEVGIPLNISFVPVYTKWDLETASEQRIPFTREPDFLTWLREAKASGVNFILHGVTHALEEVMNPIGVSGVDYEFWNVVTDSAPSDGTATFLLDRLDYAYEFLSEEDMHPTMWLTPHYLASPTEYRVLAHAFEWQVGRITYFIDEPTGLPSYWTNEMLDLLMFRPGNNKVSEARRHYYQNYRNEFDDYKLGQLFPYEIYGDVYGQKIIPESLGNVTPKHLGGGVERTIDEILEDAKRNRVLRDAWASVFFHPFLLNSIENGGMGEYNDDNRSLYRLLKGLKDLDYNFMPVNEFMNQQRHVPRVVAEELK